MFDVRGRSGSWRATAVPTEIGMCKVVRNRTSTTDCGFDWQIWWKLRVDAFVEHLYRIIVLRACSVVISFRRWVDKTIWKQVHEDWSRERTKDRRLSPLAYHVRACELSALWLQCSPLSLETGWRDTSDRFHTENTRNGCDESFTLSGGVPLHYDRPTCVLFFLNIKFTYKVAIFQPVNGVLPFLVCASFLLQSALWPLTGLQLLQMEVGHLVHFGNHNT